MNASTHRSNPDRSCETAKKLDLLQTIVLGEAINHLVTHTDFISEEMENICLAYGLKPLTVRSILAELNRRLWLDTPSYKRANRAGNMCQVYRLHIVGQLRLANGYALWREIGTTGDA